MINFKDKVGTLLSYFFPSTIIYSTDDKNTVLISEWLDVLNKKRERNKTTFDDLYVSFYITKADLKRFINGELCHYNLFKCAIDGVYYEHIDEIKNDTQVKEICFDDINPGSLPVLEKSYFKTSIAGPDYEKIKDIL